MLTTGIRSEVGVKVFGSDLKVLQERAEAVGEALRRIPGAADVYAEQVTGAPYLDVRVDRQRAARYGIAVGAIQDVIEMAVGGNVLVTAPNGTRVPLAQVADIRRVSGPAMISSEHGLLVVTVLLNVRGRDVGGVVDEARAVVARTVPLPPGADVEWSGQYENEARARRRLQIVGPIVLLVIFVLLYLTYRSFLDAAQVLLAVPFALAGGVHLVYALGYNMSVAVWIGFVALFGTAVQTAVVTVIYLEEAVARKREALGGRLTRGALREAVKEGALLRLRPKVTTVATVVGSLLPIMWSGSTGAEVMKPLATPVLGGMVSSLGLVLVVTPVIFCWLRERELRQGEAERGVDRRGGPARPAGAPAGWTTPDTEGRTRCER
jgi:Cu(I)/Ag(I) efflux system membrane protein CusA/SilA